MNGTPEEHAELIELEHEVARLVDDFKHYRETSNDDRKQTKLNLKQIKIGQKANRLKELRKIVYGKEV